MGVIKVFSTIHCHPWCISTLLRQWAPHERHGQANIIPIIDFESIGESCFVEENTVYKTKYVFLWSWFSKIALILFFRISGRRWLEIHGHGGGQGLPLGVYNRLCVWNCGAISSATAWEHRKVLIFIFFLPSESFRWCVCSEVLTIRKGQVPLLLNHNMKGKANYYNLKSPDTCLRCAGCSLEPFTTRAAVLPGQKHWLSFPLLCTLCFQEHAWPSLS